MWDRYQAWRRERAVRRALRRDWRRSRPGLLPRTFFGAGLVFGLVGIGCAAVLVPVVALTWARMERLELTLSTRGETVPLRPGAPTGWEPWTLSAPTRIGTVTEVVATPVWWGNGAGWWVVPFGPVDPGRTGPGTTLRVYRGTDPPVDAALYTWNRRLGFGLVRAVVAEDRFEPAPVRLAGTDGPILKVDGKPWDETIREGYGMPLVDQERRVVGFVGKDGRLVRPVELCQAGLFRCG